MWYWIALSGCMCRRVWKWNRELSFFPQHDVFSLVCPPDNPRQSSHVPVYIRLLDINDNAPTFATVYETFVCERTKAGQVLLTFWLLSSAKELSFNIRNLINHINMLIQLHKKGWMLCGHFRLGKYVHVCLLPVKPNQDILHDSEEKSIITQCFRPFLAASLCSQKWNTVWNSMGHSLQYVGAAEIVNVKFSCIRETMYEWLYLHRHHV